MRGVAGRRAPSTWPPYDRPAPARLRVRVRVRVRDRVRVRVRVRERVRERVRARVGLHTTSQRLLRLELG